MKLNLVEFEVAELRVNPGGETEYRDSTYVAHPEDGWFPANRPWAKITILRLSMNTLISLPDLPEGLTELHVQNNRLTHLPRLPATLITLRCEYNFLTSLPPLPEGLEALSCAHNLLQTLPPIPESLKCLGFPNNQIATLGTLPQGLKMLWCSHNLLEDLPDLPASLKILACHQNPLCDRGICPGRLPPKTLEAYKNFGVAPVNHLKEMVQKYEKLQRQRVRRLHRELMAELVLTPASTRTLGTKPPGEDRP